jgi:hypothetical protein
MNKPFGGSCPGFNWIEEQVDSATADIWLFDATTGQLVAVIQDGPDDGSECIAGPSGFVQPPSCPSSTDGTYSCGADASVDGGDASIA